VSECSLTPTSNFPAISWQEQDNFSRGPLCTRPTRLAGFL